MTYYQITLRNQHINLITEPERIDFQGTSCAGCARRRSAAILNKQFIEVRVLKGLEDFARGVECGDQVGEKGRAYGDESCWHCGVLDVAGDRT